MVSSAAGVCEGDCFRVEFEGGPSWVLRGRFGVNGDVGRSASRLVTAAAATGSGDGCCWSRAPRASTEMAQFGGAARFGARGRGRRTGRPVLSFVVDGPSVATALALMEQRRDREPRASMEMALRGSTRAVVGGGPFVLRCRSLSMGRRWQRRWRQWRWGLKKGKSRKDGEGSEFGLGALLK